MQSNNGNGDDYNYRNKLSNVKPAGTSKSAYEIRVELLRLAFDMCIFNRTLQSRSMEAKDIVEAANTFNEFISKKND